MRAHGPDRNPCGLGPSSEIEVTLLRDDELTPSIRWVRITMTHPGGAMGQGTTDRHAFAVAADKIHHIRTLMRLVETVVPELDGSHDVALVVVLTVSSTKVDDSISIHQFIATAFDNKDDTETLSLLVANAIKEGTTAGPVIHTDRKPLPTDVM